MRGSVDGVKQAGFGFVAATFTACHADGGINLGAIEAQAADLVRQRLRGAFVCGTTGESASLTTAERMAVAGRWSEVAKPDLEVIVHVGHTSLGDARALAAHAERIGAAGIAAVPPFYFRPRTVAELVDFSARIAAAAPRTPFYYYHIPALTGVALPMAEFLPAAMAAIPTLAGVKFTDEDLADYARCLELADGRYEIFFGRDEILLAALGLGARSGVGTTYNFAAPLLRRMYEAFAQGDLDEARRWQAGANRMIDTAVAHGGIPAFKTMTRWLGIDCGPCRPPLVSLDEDHAARLRSDLERIGFFEALAGAKGPVTVAGS
jgi:N-acetylneuraminate lyase